MTARPSAVGCDADEDPPSVQCAGPSQRQASQQACTCWIYPIPRMAVAWSLQNEFNPSRCGPNTPWLISLPKSVRDIELNKTNNDYALKKTQIYSTEKPSHLWPVSVSSSLMLYSGSKLSDVQRPRHSTSKQAAIGVDRFHAPQATHHDRGDEQRKAVVESLDCIIQV